MSVTSPCILGLRTVSESLECEMLVKVTKSQCVIESMPRTFTMQGLTSEAITAAEGLTTSM